MELSILTYREEGVYVALALEMDIRGYGATKDEAHKELSELILSQVSFAIFKGQPELLYFPAEPQFFRTFLEAKTRAMRRFVDRSEPEDTNYSVASFPLPPRHVIASMRPEFTRTEA